jgi:hypothetical protein
MAKEDETPGANPAEIENLIKQIRGTNLEPGAKEKIERENSVNRIDIGLLFSQAGLILLANSVSAA